MNLYAWSYSSGDISLAMLELIGSQMGCVEKRRGPIKEDCGLLQHVVFLLAVAAKKRGCEGVLLMKLLLLRHCLAEINLETATEDAGS